MNIAALRWPVLAAAVSLGACRHPAPPPPTTEEMRAIEAMARVQFPPSTRVRTWHHERGIDEYLDIKFEIGASEWDQFLSSSPFRGEVLDETHRSDLGPDHGEWDPGKPTHLTAAQVALPGGKFVNLGVDDSRHDVVVVYLTYFGT